MSSSRWAAVCLLILVVILLYQGRARAADASTTPNSTLTSWAFVIYEHKFPVAGQPPGQHKTINLKFILLSIEGMKRLVIFQDTPSEGQSKDGTLKWYWRNYREKPAKHGAAPAPTLATYPGTTGTPLSVMAQAKGTDTAVVLPQEAQKTIDNVGAKVEAWSNAQELSTNAPAVPCNGVLNGLKFTVSHLDMSDPRFMKSASPFNIDSGSKTSGTIRNPNAFLNNSNAVTLASDTGNEPKNHRGEFIKKYLMYRYVVGWLLANYAANSPTLGAQKGNEVIGVAALDSTQEVDDSDANKPVDSITFRPFYCDISSGPTSATITHAFSPTALIKDNDITPEADTQALLDFISGLNAGQAFPDAPDKCKAASTPAPTPARAAAPAGLVAASPSGAPALAAPAAPSPSNPTTTDDSGAKIPAWYSYKPQFKDPKLTSDSTGTDVGITLVLSPPDRSGNKDKSKDDDTFNPEPTITIKGDTYINADFYNISVAPQWNIPFGETSNAAASPPAKPAASPGAAASSNTVTDTNPITINSPLTVGATFSRNQQPNGQATKTTTSGAATFALSGSDQLGTFNFTLKESPGVDAVSNNMTGKPAVNTTQIHSTTYSQQVWHAYITKTTQGTTLTDTPDLSNRDREELYKHMISLQMDLDEWINPTDSEQNSDFFTSAAGTAHIGGDIPVWYTGIDGSPEFIRLDASATGGGIIGEAPSTSQFYGGNTPVAAGPSTLPAPVIRSFGTGRLGLYPDMGTHVSGTAGAVSFANANFTLAIPVGLSWRFLSDKDDGARLFGLFNSNDPKTRLAEDDAAYDDINYVANYDDIFSLKPVFTCDAAWMGAPANYQDRNLVSLGGGAEFSLTSFNLDVLYEATVHDSAAKYQRLGENIIVQLSYDIHF
jgi:hypothetical protein